MEGVIRPAKMSRKDASSITFIDGIAVASRLLLRLCDNIVKDYIIVCEERQGGYKWSARDGEFRWNGDRLEWCIRDDAGWVDIRKTRVVDESEPYLYEGLVDMFEKFFDKVDKA